MTINRSSLRSSSKSTERTSASGHPGPARSAGFLTFEAANNECASSTAICTRSAQVIPMHIPSSWIPRAAGRSEAPMSRSLCLVAKERSCYIASP